MICEVISCLYFIYTNRPCICDDRLDPQRQLIAEFNVIARQDTRKIDRQFIVKFIP